MHNTSFVLILSAALSACGGTNTLGGSPTSDPQKSSASSADEKKQQPSTTPVAPTKALASTLPSPGASDPARTTPVPEAKTGPTVVDDPLTLPPARAGRGGFTFQFATRPADHTTPGIIEVCRSLYLSGLGGVTHQSMLSSATATGTLCQIGNPATEGKCSCPAGLGASITEMRRKDAWWGMKTAGIVTGTCGQQIVCQVKVDCVTGETAQPYIVTDALPLRMIGSVNNVETTLAVVEFNDHDLCKIYPDNGLPTDWRDIQK